MYRPVSPPPLQVKYWLASALACALLALFSCAAAVERLEMPADIGEWKSSGVSAVEVSAIPDTLRRLEAQSASRGIYKKGELEVAVTLFQMPSTTSAFEAVQTYHRRADEYYFQKGATFIVLELKELPIADRRPFLVAFQKATAPNGPESEDK